MRWRFFVSEALNSIRGNAATTLAATVTVLIVTFLMGIFVTTGWWVYHYAVEKRNEVTVKLYKGAATVVARSSPYALYDRALAGFGESGGEFSQAASPGFIELFTLQSRLAHRVRSRRPKGG